MENNKVLQDFSVKNALIITLIYIVSLLLLYVIGISYFGGLSRIYPFFIIMIGVIVVGFRLRKLNGGFIEFKSALKYVYMMFVIIEISATAFNLVMYKIVDPNMDSEMKQLAIQETESWMEKFSQSQDKIDEAVKRVQEKDITLTYGKAFLGLGIWLIVDFLFALIIAAIIKKDKMIAEMEGDNKMTV